MCGIGGCVVARGARPPADRLAAMRDALAHRGPDDSGMATFDNVGLVHTRLSIVDTTSNAHQPMRDGQAGWVLAFNGEIFNHREIRRELGDPRLVSSGDTAALLAALVRRGTDAIPDLNGQFAFAALDETGRRLVLCRDRLGIKPLYVAHTDDGLWFASELSALRAAGVRQALRPDAQESILEGTCYGGENTLVSGISRLEPGCLLVVDIDDGSVEMDRWYEPVDDVDPELQSELERRGRSELVSVLEQTVRTAVHDQLLGDAKIGTLLSGGVDSSLIAALAAEVKPDLLAIGARRRGDPAGDEGPAARRAAAALGIELDLIEVTESGWRHGFVPATVHFGLPLTNATSVPIAQMAERGRQHGAKVLLTGEGADELFGGYGSHHTAGFREFSSSSAWAVRVMEPYIFGSPLRHLTAETRRIGSQVKARVLSGPARAATADRSPVDLDHVAHAYAHHSGPRRAVETALLGRLDYTLCHLLNRMDANMMQASVEARVPFLDQRLVHFALNLPLESRIGPWSKGVLRDVARKVLPLRIAHRPKIYGMDYDAGAWIERAADPGFLLDGHLREALRIPARDLKETLVSTSGALRVRLWSAEVWYRSLIEGQTTTEIESALWPHGP